jgi:2-keto-4-pentenoate hydratase/2-oxohepta-3-ene-1,7-dioic acid hydratase in catechol pathway
MKLISYRANGRESFGLLEGDGIIDVGRLQGASPSDLRAAIEAGLGGLKSLAGRTPDHLLEAVEVLPVISNPDKILCIGINYMAHIKETGNPTPEHPWIFVRFPNSQVGHGQPMLRPAESEKFDYEGELAVVIGTRARRVPRHRALEYVAGYSCYNDGSVRDWQRHSPLFTPGKNFYHSGAFGPWLVTADEIPDPRALTVETRLNGRVMQHAPVSDLLFDVPALIEYISTFTELVPGDVIVTGTPGGVGARRNPPVWMKAGDIVEIEISQIGTLRNPIVDEEALLRTRATP